MSEPNRTSEQIAVTVLTKCSLKPGGRCKTKTKLTRPRLAPLRVWEAYTMLENVKGTSPVSKLTTLVSLIPRVTDIDGN